MPIPPLELYCFGMLMKSMVLGREVWLFMHCIALSLRHGNIIEMDDMGKCIMTTPNMQQYEIPSPTQITTCFSKILKLCSMMSPFERKSRRTTMRRFKLNESDISSSKGYSSLSRQRYHMHKTRAFLVYPFPNMTLSHSFSC